MRHKPDPYLRTMPWKIEATYGPIERIFGEIIRTGECDAEGEQLVFVCQNTGRNHDLIAAIRGIIEFHRIAETRFGIPADITAIECAINKLASNEPIDEALLERAMASLKGCKKQAGRIRCSQANEIVKDLEFQERQQKIRQEPHDHPEAVPAH